MSEPAKTQETGPIANSIPRREWKTMASSVGAFLALFIAVFTLMVGVGLLSTFLSLRTLIAGFATQTTGLIMASYFLGISLGSFVGPRLVQRVGHIRAYSAFAAIAGAAALSHGLLLNPFTWAVLRFASGIAMFGLYMVIESWLNECTQPEFRGRVFSVYMILSYLGMACGQLLLNVGDVRNGQLFMVAGILFTLSLIPVSVTRSVYPTLPTVSRFNLVELIRQAPIGMAGCFTAGLINSAFYAMGPVFCSRIGLTVSQTSYFMMTAILGGLLLQWPMGTISDRFDRPFVLSILGAVLAVMGLVIQATSTQPFILLLPIMLVYGGLNFAIYPVSVARAHDLFDPSEIVSVSTALIFCYGFGACIGPVAASSVMAVSNRPDGLFTFVTGVAAVFAALVFILRTKEKVTVVTAEDQASFIPMKNTSPVAMVMDPRSKPDTAAGDEISRPETSLD